MQAWGLSNPGNVRTENQDCYDIVRFDDKTLLAIVCDGMGGARSGNVASKLAAEVFIQEVQRWQKPDLSQDSIDQMLRSAVKLANFTVNDQSRQFDEFSGMGTTLVAVYIAGGKASVVNIGDSRAYYIGPDEIRCITVDHSVVQMMVQRGELTQEQAKQYPGKNLITRAVGPEPYIESDLYHLPLPVGCSILLCSDGLSNLLADQEILFEVVHGVNKQLCCQRLLDIAKSRGAPDNVTSVLVMM